MNQNDWLARLALYRSINKSNVILVETSDPKRYQQLLSALQKDLLTRGEKKYKKIYEVSIQTREIIPLRGEPIFPNGPITLELYKRLREEPMLIVMAWVMTRTHADNLLDFLVSVAQNPSVYAPMSELSSSRPPFLPSTVIVFTQDLTLFPDNAREFFAEVRVPPSTSEEREVIIRNLVKDAEALGYKVSVSSDAVVASSGLNLHEIETACLESIKIRGIIDAETFRKYKIELLSRLGLTYVEPKYGFESVGGYSYLKSFLNSRIVNFYRNPNIVAKYGLRPPRGILLFGPPGTGKSWLARALAKEMGLPMISLSSADLLRGIVGESEQRVKKITTIVESMAPVLIFIDEADQLFQSRGAVLSTDSGVFRRVQNILLEWLGDEERKSFVVMATNYLEQFDFASVRAGRIDYAIPVMLPDLEARKQILKLHTEVLSKPNVPVKVDYDNVARLTEGYTGAELRQLSETAKILAAEENSNVLATEHFNKALSSIKINVEQRMMLVHRMIEQARKIETVIIPEELLEKARLDMPLKDSLEGARTRL